ncbi:MAG: 3-dehydroquinate synthase [Thermoprotei archaeon]|nr:3-dehydroquinate synthase family protein [TACK group archaeon]
MVSPSALEDEAIELSRGLNAGLYLLPDGERAKSPREVTSLLRWLYGIGMTRKDWIIAFGGGTVSDVAGFASSIYMRGTMFATAPTTLLAAVDASLGGKNAVNFAGVKNLIGTIRQPSLVAVDVGLLRKLPDLELRNGMAEVIKYAISLDGHLFRYLEEKKAEVLSKGRALDEIIIRSIDIKMRVVARDELDLTGTRAVLNVGHTFAHALEAGSSFSLPHGLAVAAGISMECSLGNRLGITSEAAVHGARSLLRGYGLPQGFNDLASLLKRFSLSAALRAMATDKKLGSDGMAIVPFVTEIGRWRPVELSLDELRSAFREAVRS